MARRTTPPFPRVSRVLAELGENIRLARTRRNLSAELVAERAGMSRPTLRAIERGRAGVTLGAVANVLNTLGLVDDLVRVGRDDELGRELEDARLAARQRVHPPKARASRSRAATTRASSGDSTARPRAHAFTSRRS